MNEIEGGCFCGAVRYAARGKPVNTMVCHCTSCRRIAGSPVVAWITVAREEFRFTRGKPAEFRSTPPVRRTFCGKCGTPLTYENDDSPGTIDITTCTQDAPAAFPPTHHSWLEDNVGWVRFGDGLPEFSQFRPG